MKKVIIIFLIIAAFVAAFIIWKGCNASKIVKQATSNSKRQSDTVTDADRWRNKWGEVYAEKEQIRGQLAALKITNAEEIDEASRRMQIKDRQIDGLQKIVAEFKAKLSAKVNTGTNDKGEEIQWFTQEDESVKQTTTITGDSAHTDLKFTFTANTAQTWKRKWFFGDKKHMFNAWFTDPRITVTNLKDIEVTDTEPSRWGVSLFAGYGTMNFNGLGFVGGAGVTYTLLRR